MLAVHCDGCGPDLKARVSYVSPDPEFTPPVIYSLETRQKLVYLVEARPEGDAAALQPGQIVDVIWRWRIVSGKAGGAGRSGDGQLADRQHFQFPLRYWLAAIRRSRRRGMNAIDVHGLVKRFGTRPSSTM